MWLQNLVSYGIFVREVVVIFVHRYVAKSQFRKREYLVIILIMPELHFHFLSVVTDRLQDGPAAWP